MISKNKDKTVDTGDVLLNRYPGPRPYGDTDKDRETFFGRRALSNSLKMRIIASPIVVLYGLSGLGKSSMLQAGLFQELRDKHFLPIKVQVNQPLPLLKLVDEAARKTCKDLKYDYVPGDMRSLWEYLKTSMFLNGDIPMSPVLVFDQFEEIFTLRDKAFRDSFAAEVGPVVSGNLPVEIRERMKNEDAAKGFSESPPDVRVLISLREEYLGALEELSSPIPGLFAESLRLLPLKEAQAEEAIREPARKPISDKLPFSSTPFEYDDDAINKIITFLKGRKGYVEPFQIQLLCQHYEQMVLNGKKKPGGDGVITITPDDIGGPGEMDRILRTYYESNISELPWKVRRSVRLLFEEGLLDPKGRRLPLQKEQIIADYGVGADTIKILLKKHLLKEDPRLDSMFYEISHDRLAQSIVQTRRWRIPRKYKPVLAAIAVFIVSIAAIMAYYGRALALQDALQKTTQQTLDLNKLIQDQQKKQIEQQKRMNEESIERERLALVTSQANKLMKEKAQENEQKALNREKEARKSAENLVGFLIGEDLMEPIRATGRRPIMEKVNTRVNEYLNELPKSAEFKGSEFNRALALINDGYLDFSKGNLTEAQRHYRDAHDILEGLSSEDPGNLELKRQLAKAKTMLGQAASQRLRIGDSLRWHSEALDIRGQLAKQTAERDSQHEEIERDLAESHNFVAENLRAQGRLTEALEHYDDAIKIAKKYEYAKSPKWLYVVQEGYGGVGDVYNSQGREEKALEAYVELKKNAEMATDISQYEPEAQHKLGLAIYRVARQREYDKPKDAIDQYNKLKKTLEYLTNWDRDNAYWEMDLAATAILIGDAEVSIENYEAATGSYHDAKSKIDGLTEIDSENKSWLSNLVWVNTSLGSLYYLEKEYEKSLECYQSAIDIQNGLVLIDRSNLDQVVSLAELYILKANALIAQYAINNESEKYDEALNTYDKALELYKSSTSIDETYIRHHAGIQWVGREKGKALLMAERLDDANAVYEESYSALREYLNRIDDNAFMWSQLFRLDYECIAPLRDMLGDPEGSRAAYGEALNAIEKSVKIEEESSYYRSSLGKAYQALGDIFSERGESDKALGYYRKSEDAFIELTGMRQDSAVCWISLFELYYYSIGPKLTETQGFDGALDAYEDAIEAAKEAVDLEQENAGYRKSLSLAYEKFGDLYSAMYESSYAALPYYASCKEQLQILADSAQDNDEYLSDIWELLYNKTGPLYENIFDTDGAFNTYLEATAVAERAVKINPTSPENHERLGLACLKVGGLRYEEQDISGALKYYQMAEASLTKATEQQSDSAGYWNDLFLLNYDSLAPLHKEQDDASAAMKSYLSAINAEKTALKLQPDNAVYHANLGLAYQKVGDILRDEKKFDDALAYYQMSETEFRQATELQNDVAPHWNCLAMLYIESVATLYEKQNDNESRKQALTNARTAVKRAAKLEEENGAEYSYIIGRMNELIGDIQLKDGKIQEALVTYNEAVKYFEAAVDQKKGEDDLEYRKCLIGLIADNLTDLYFALDDNAGAQRALQRAVSAYEEIPKWDRWDDELHFKNFYVHMKLMVCQMNQGMYEDAIKSYEIADQELRKAIELKEDPIYWCILSVMLTDFVAPMQEKTGNIPEAIMSYTEAISAAEKASGLEPGNGEYQDKLDTAINKYHAALTRLSDCEESSPEQ